MKCTSRKKKNKTTLFYDEIEKIFTDEGLTVAEAVEKYKDFIRTQTILKKPKDERAFVIKYKNLYDYLRRAEKPASFLEYEGKFRYILDLECDRWKKAGEIESAHEDLNITGYMNRLLRKRFKELNADMVQFENMYLAMANMQGDLKNTPVYELMKKELEEIKNRLDFRGFWLLVRCSFFQDYLYNNFKILVYCSRYWDKRDKVHFFIDFAPMGTPEQREKATKLLKECGLYDMRNLRQKF